MVSSRWEGWRPELAESRWKNTEGHQTFGRPCRWDFYRKKWILKWCCLCTWFLFMYLMVTVFGNQKRRDTPMRTRGCRGQWKLVRICLNLACWARAVGKANLFNTTDFHFVVPVSLPPWTFGGFHQLGPVTVSAMKYWRSIQYSMDGRVHGSWLVYVKLRQVHRCPTHVQFWFILISADW